MQFLRAFLLFALFSFTRAMVVPAEVEARANTMSTSQVIVNIKTVTTASSNLNTLLSGVTISMGPSVLVLEGQKVVTGFTQIVQSLQTFTTQMQGNVFSGNDAALIAAALTTFVHVHQDLLATVIGQHGLFAYCAFTAPIAAILRTLEAIIDTFAFALISLIPGQQSVVVSGQNMLDVTCTQAISTYSAICIPFIPPPGICIGLSDLASNNGSATPAARSEPAEAYRLSGF